MPTKPYCIAIIGPESTGKSTLASALAAHYNTHWLPEYARTYCDTLNRPYSAEDIIIIAQTQHQQAEAFIQTNSSASHLFFDTTPIVEKIWLAHAFNRTNPIIEDLTNAPIYQHYLLCNVDTPWQPDHQREHPHLRSYFFDIYLAAMKALANPFTIISGVGQQRLKSAINTIEKLIPNNA